MLFVLLLFYPSYGWCIDAGRRALNPNASPIPGVKRQNDSLIPIWLIIFIAIIASLLLFMLARIIHLWCTGKTANRPCDREYSAVANNESKGHQAVSVPRESEAIDEGKILIWFDMLSTDFEQSGLYWLSFPFVQMISREQREGQATNGLMNNHRLLMPSVYVNHETIG